MCMGLQPLFDKLNALVGGDVALFGNYREMKRSSSENTAKVRGIGILIICNAAGVSLREFF